VPAGGNQDELVLLALGGIGEIGMNCYLYGLGPPDKRQWLMVDLGLTFPEGENDPGVDVILPDLRYIEAERGSLAGLLLTHAHEDHFGAVIELWPRLRVPIYATPFTAALLRAKAAEFGKRQELPIKEVALDGRFSVGPFALELVEMAHSIPESNALLLRTPLGTVLHTGDWKLDATPVVGRTVSPERLAEIGTEGITALVCDSTNAMREGRSPSERDVARSLAQIVGQAKRRVIVTIFASNVARIRAVWEAARSAGRRLVVAGRAMHRIIDVAMATGYLPPDFEYDDQSRFPHLEAGQVVALCTGSQGEPRAAMSRIAADEHPDIELDRGDLVIFSSRTIPGNERAVGQIQNRLVDIGCEVLTDADALVHVTGHPRRDELKDMYAAIKPRLAIPMHGEPRHLEAHRKLAREAGVREVLSVRNGAMVRLAPRP
jgi:ribonuclease J